MATAHASAAAGDLVDEKDLGAIEQYENSSMPVTVSAEDDKRIRRKTDWRILTILCLVFGLQVLDKNVMGYTATVGLKTDANLKGNEYSTLSSIAAYAQLACQPLGAFLLVRFPINRLLAVLMFCWGGVLMGMAGATNFPTLTATRFLLGAFESLSMPAFTLSTVTWYRRAEQPLRMALWYCQNGTASILGAFFVWALSHGSPKLHVYQITFLFTGGLTLLFVPVAWLFWDEKPEKAKFLSPEDRLKAVERLKANQTSSANKKFDWSQIKELFLDPKTYLFATLAVLCNIVPFVYNTFGSILLETLVGFDKKTVLLLNMPYGALQIVCILLTSWCATRFRVKSLFFALLYVPPVIGYALLYTLPRTDANIGPLLFGFYLTAFAFGASPLLVAWIGANTAGSTKKAGLVSIYQACSAAGNIIAPNLFRATDAPLYRNGLKYVLVLVCIALLNIALLVLLLRWQNAQKKRQRVAQGKPADLKDVSMALKLDNSDDQLHGIQEIRLDSSSEQGVEGDLKKAELVPTQAEDEDQTDRQNVMFIYVY
ncbi:hypothetical protein JCM8115_001390 [Rhodotorula mucilaginosa]|uniref:MFS general substrate transporter n=1 Tax=Rhodotorula mucilaginosa TaxID=5537 RepID=A0A9P6W1I2_RHOMI|nr:hypothetical protein C6P46_005101 [Rhodotorula mucilaginosa]TKA53877.1 hypothetical protein B0A53_03667 [Rhodotorula sp. CCFEE 5036]